MISRPILLVGSLRPITAPILAASHGSPVSLITTTTSSALTQGLTKFTAVVALRADEDLEAWVEAALLLNSRQKFEAVGAWDERFIWAAAHIASALQLPFHSTSTVGLLRDKLALRGFLAQRGLSLIEAAEISSAQDIQIFGSERGWPVVVKPRDASGSSGVSIVRNANDVCSAWESLTQAPWKSNLGGMVEEFAGTDEVGIDCYSEDGNHVLIGHSSHIKGVAHPIEFGHVVPSTLDPATLDVTVSYVFACLDALGIRNGITSSEVIGGTKPCLIETHVRPSGGELAKIYGERLGIDLFDLLSRRLMGQSVIAELANPLLGDDCHRPEVVWFSGPNGSGRLVKLDGIEEARRIDGVTEVSLKCQPGDRIEAPRSSLDRVLHVRARGASVSEALEAARLAAGLVRFTIEADTLNPPLVLPLGITPSLPVADL